MNKTKAFDLMSSEEYILIETNLLRLVKIAAKPGLFRVKLDENKFPLSIIESEPRIRREFYSLIESKHNSKLRRSDSIIEQGGHVKRREQVSIEDWSKSINDDLEAFSRRHFVSFRVHAADMLASPEVWTRMRNELMTAQHTRQRVVCVIDEDSSSIDVYGLCDEVARLKQTIANLTQRPKSKELGPIEAWKVVYFRRFARFGTGDENLRVTVVDENRIITILGRDDTVERVYIDILSLLASIRCERLQIEPNLLKYFLAIDNLDETLNKLIEKFESRIIFVKYNRSLCVVGPNEADFSICKLLVETDFITDRCELATPVLVDLVKSKTFEEFLLQQLGLSHHEQTK